LVLCVVVQRRAHSCLVEAEDVSGRADGDVTTLVDLAKRLRDLPNIATERTGLSQARESG
jgi:hypothetical protein